MSVPAVSKIMPTLPISSSMMTLRPRIKATLGMIEATRLSEPLLLGSSTAKLTKKVMIKIMIPSVKAVLAIEKNTLINTEKAMHDSPKKKKNTKIRKKLEYENMISPIITVAKILFL